MPAIGTSRPHRVNGRRLATVALLALVALGLGGCTARLVYDQLDTLVAWWIEDRIDLDAAQEDRLEQLIAARLDWHRGTQLPRYAESLAALSADAGRPLGRERIDVALAETDAWGETVMAQVAPEAAAFLAGLSDAQVDGLFRELEERAAKERRERAKRSPEQRLERRAKRTIRNVERWTGRLDEAQRAAIRRSLAGAEPLGDAWEEVSAAWRAEFRRVLAGRATDPGYARGIERLFARPETLWPEAYRAASARNRERYVTLVAEVDASLSPKQRAHLVRELATWATDLRALARE